MKCTINENLSYWIKILEYINNTVTQIQLYFKKDGLNITELDINHVALIECNINTSFFKEYEIDEEIQFDINIKDYINILKKNKKMNIDRLEISFDNKDNKMINIFYKSNAKKGNVHKLSTIQRDNNKIDVNVFRELNPINSLSLNVETIPNIVEQALIYSDQLDLDLDVDKKCLSFKSVGNMGEFEYNLEEDDEDIYEHSYKESINKTSFTLTYLKNISNVSNLTDKIIIEFEFDKPIFFEFDLIEKNNVFGNIFAVIAPRIEQTDE